jgi:hypothetical protein
MVTLTMEAIRDLARIRARDAVADAVSRYQRPAVGLDHSIRVALQEVESHLRLGSLDLLLRGRASPEWKEIVARADSYLPRPCAGCQAPVWPGARLGSLVYRCDECWSKFVWGARLVARAQTDSELRAGLKLAFPNLDQ